MQDCICDVVFMWKWGWGHTVVMAMLLRGMQNAKKLNETMDNACPINPKKNSGALSYLFYAYWATSGGPQSSPIPHPPTYGVDP